MSAPHVLLVLAALALPVQAQQVSLQALVTPSTTIMKDGHPVTFALHGFIEFKTLADMFPYIDSQKQRWKPSLDDAARQRLASELLRRGIESRVVSMIDERPLEALVTHTSGELRQALAQVKEPVPPGYGEAFLAVQEKWKHSLNCWSAAPSIPARVLSNWYPIEEGIELYGSTYDSTEHFWQAVKYHPDVTVAQLTELLGVLEHRDWGPWLQRLDADPKLYLPNAYAIEFLRYNLAPRTDCLVSRRTGGPRTQFFRSCPAGAAARRRRISLQRVRRKSPVGRPGRSVPPGLSLLHAGRPHSEDPGRPPLRRNLSGRAQNGFHQRRIPLPDARNLAREVSPDATLPRGDQLDPDGNQAVPLPQRRRLSGHPHPDLHRVPEPNPRPGPPPHVGASAHARAKES